jgi:hypothetical protein
MLDNDLTYQMAMMQLEMEMQLERQRAKQQQAQQRGGSGGGLPPGSTTALRTFLSSGSGSGGAAGSGGTTAGSSAGTSGFGSSLAAFWPAAVVGGAVLAGHLASNATDRRFNGTKTNDAFAGHFFTDPFQSFGYQKLGIEDPTSGELLDAAVNNGSFSDFMKIAPQQFHSMAMPGIDWTRDLTDKINGKFSNVVDPIGKLFKSIF